MSGSQHQQRMPYIGSKISLISKLDIRYEGTLYTVDPIESTIALAKVHSYGTEDRRTPVFVPPRDEVYDFIIFKASDIKDLIVCEQPKANSPHNMTTGLPYDPAIVSISKNPPPEPKLPNKMNMMGPGGVGNGMGMGGGGNIADKLGARHSFEHLLGGPMRFAYRYPPNNFQPPPPRVQRTSGSNANDGPPVFDKDYDFEEANEQFREKINEDLKTKVEKQLELKEKEEEAAKGEENENRELPAMTEAQMEFYNKNNSFFDNISCDALEKESGKSVRPDWKRERQTNQETFGHQAVRSFFYQRRGARGYGGMGMVPFNNRYNNYRNQSGGYYPQVPPQFRNYAQQPQHYGHQGHEQQQHMRAGAGYRHY